MVWLARASSDESAPARDPAQGVPSDSAPRSKSCTDSGSLSGDSPRNSPRNTRRTSVVGISRGPVTGCSSSASTGASSETSTGTSRGLSAGYSRRVLAIDYGRSRLGLAVSDTMGVTARPLDTWTRVNRRHDLARLRDLCRAQAVGRIIVGWPLRLDGQQSEMAKEAARFAARVHKNLGLPVELVDERLSSWEAGQLVADGAVRGRRARERRSRMLVDDVAAAVILRDYLARARALADRSEGPEPSVADESPRGDSLPQVTRGSGRS